MSRSLQQGQTEITPQHCTLNPLTNVPTQTYTSEFPRYSLDEILIFKVTTSRAGSVADFPCRYLASVKPYLFRDTEKKKLRSSISPIK